MFKIVEKKILNKIFRNVPRKNKEKRDGNADTRTLPIRSKISFVQNRLNGLEWPFFLVSENISRGKNDFPVSTVQLLNHYLTLQTTFSPISCHPY